MINNDTLRRIRFIFDLDDSKMMGLFKLGGLEATREQISAWLKKDDDPAFVLCADFEMATFLNGFIIDRRGPKDDSTPEPEKKLTNNIVFRKLKIALNLKDDDILTLLKNVDFTISKHELSALFRKSDHKHYRECQTQFLRNFLKGIQLKYRPDA